MIRAVFLDIDNTLLDFERCAAESIRLGLAEKGIVYQEEWIHTYTRINDALWRSLERGEITIEQLYAVRFVRVFDELGIEAGGASFEKQFKHYLHESHIPVPGALELLRYLAPKYKLYAASNGPYEQQAHRLTLAGMRDYFQELFVSERIGAQKPTNAFFFACFDALPELQPDEVMLIGDSLTADIAGGNAYGIPTVWYNHRHEENRTGIVPRYTVDSLEQVKELL